MEFTKEEKKAIEILKKLQKKTPYIIWGDGTPYNKSNQIQTILNLIEKLNFENHMVKKWNEQLDKNCISKDKIREKIVDLETKLAIETIDNKYNQEERDEETIPKYKIREKIKELEKLYNINLEEAMTSYEMFHFVRSYIDKVKNILEELLEENK